MILEMHEEEGSVLKKKLHRYSWFGIYRCADPFLVQEITRDQALDLCDRNRMVVYVEKEGRLLFGTTGGSRIV